MALLVISTEPNLHIHRFHSDHLNLKIDMIVMFTVITFKVLIEMIDIVLIIVIIKIIMIISTLIWR